MKLIDATLLIREAPINRSKPQCWIDLGCGEGLFSRALGELLCAGSKIIGIDREPQASYAQINEQIAYSFIKADLLSMDTLHIEAEGVMMANSLHFVEHQKIFIQKLIAQFGTRIKLILVEYDNDEKNAWVPFPISKKRLVDIFPSSEFSITFIGERSSTYQSKMYAAFIEVKIPK